MYYGLHCLPHAQKHSTDENRKSSPSSSTTLAHEQRRTQSRDILCEQARVIPTPPWRSPPSEFSDGGVQLTD